MSNNPPVNTNQSAPQLRWNNDDAQTNFSARSPFSPVVEPSSSAHSGLYAQLTKSVSPSTKRHRNNKYNNDAVANNDSDDNFSKARSRNNRAEILSADNDDHGGSYPTNWSTQWGAYFRRKFTQRSSARPRDVGVQRESPDQRGAGLRRSNDARGEQSSNYDESRMPVGTQLTREFSMATATHSVKRFAKGPLHGTALALYFFLLPYVVVSRWSYSQHQSHARLVHFFLIVLGIFWVVFLMQLLYNIVQLRNGRRTQKDGSAWLAGLVLVLMPFLVSSSTSAATLLAPVPVSTSYEAPLAKPLKHEDSSSALSLLSSVPIALAAKKRKDSLRSQQFVGDFEDVDEAISLMRANSPELLSSLIERIGSQVHGTLDVTEKVVPGEINLQCAPLVVCVLSESESSTRISFSHAGGTLLVGPLWGSEEIIENCVALQSGGRIEYAHNETQLLTLLAKRLPTTIVLYLGPELSDLDLNNFCVRINKNGSSVLEPQEIRVQLLRAAPNVQGLVEPFAPALRRRCVEMTSYLALHRHEPVTGDRLRTRVLSHEEIDASLRTLSNTASAVRKSLGVGGHGPRLRPVSSSGLYETSEVTSDVEIFHEIISRARKLSTEEGAPLARSALQLVTGEPLASVLRGYEWFLAEGHQAKLLRDGEWAALCLHHDALERGDFEEAFWALEKGRLIDPYSDALSEALNAVPRLREFRSDARSTSKDQSISASGAVAMSRTLTSFSNQVTE